MGYVHFLPETVENSISLPRFAKNLFYKYMISFYKRMDYLVTVMLPEVPPLVVTWMIPLAAREP